MKAVENTTSWCLCETSSMKLMLRTSACCRRVGGAHPTFATRTQGSLPIDARGLSVHDPVLTLTHKLRARRLSALSWAPELVGPITCTPRTAARPQCQGRLQTLDLDCMAFLFPPASHWLGHCALLGYFPCYLQSTNVSSKVEKDPAKPKAICIHFTIQYG